MHLDFLTRIAKSQVFVGLLILICNGFLQAQDFASSNLPIILIDTQGSPIPDEPKIPGTMQIIDNPDGLNHITDEPNDYNGHIGIELRGSSSQWLFPKKNYGIELWTELGADTSASVLGFPAEEDWVLHGPYSDKTLMRNYLTYQIYSHTGRYSTRSRYVEVVENGSYQGVYVFLEKIKRDSSRVDISKLNADENTGDDLTGGYIIKLDKYDGSNSRGRWLSSHRVEPNLDSIWYQYEYPKGDRITEPQKDYIKSYMKAFEDVLDAPGSGDPIIGYPSLIDEGSFIDFALINELTRNVDGYRLSTFMFKDKESKGGKLHMGPIWDFNLGLGNADYCDGWRTDGWAWDFNSVCPDDYWLIPFWWSKLMSHYQFVEHFHDRWFDLRQGPWSDASIMAFIDSTSTVLEDPAQRNFQKWPTLGMYVWPNPEHMIGATYEEEILLLKQWLLDRLLWMDQNIAERYEVISSLTDESYDLSVSVFPNPFSNRLNLESDKDIESFTIHSVNGLLVASERFYLGGVHTIDVSSIERGMYTLSVNYSDGNSESIQIVKQ